MCLFSAGALKEFGLLMSRIEDERERMVGSGLLLQVRTNYTSHSLALSFQKYFLRTHIILRVKYKLNMYFLLNRFHFRVYNFNRYSYVIQYPITSFIYTSDSFKPNV